MSDVWGSGAAAASPRVDVDMCRCRLALRPTGRDVRPRSLRTPFDAYRRSWTADDHDHHDRMRADA
jgi:hypothetical protein